LGDKKIISKVEAAIADIRPFLEADGGDIRLIDVSDDLVVKVELLGACKNCSMSKMTLKAGVEESIRKSLPELKAVEAVHVKEFEVA
jgi:Fe-S cluster biogenesis protein NfuA